MSQKGIDAIIKKIALRTFSRDFCMCDKKEGKGLGPKIVTSYKQGLQSKEISQI